MLLESPLILTEGPFVETLDRVALMRKTMPDLRHMIRRLGGDSPVTEGKESLVSRILLFQPQNFKPEVRVVRAKIKPVTREELEGELEPYIKRGVELKVEDGRWFVSLVAPGYGEARTVRREDSGTLMMPLSAIVRCVRYMMPVEARP